MEDRVEEKGEEEEEIEEGEDMEEIRGGRRGGVRGGSPAVPVLATRGRNRTGSTGGQGQDLLGKKFKPSGFFSVRLEWRSLRALGRRDPVCRAWQAA